MSDPGFAWPLVNLSTVREDWLQKVWEGSALFEEYLDHSIREDADFTIRSIIFVITTMTLSELKWYLEESIHLGRCVQIHELIHSHNPDQNMQGMEELKRLIQDFISDAKVYLN